MSDFQRLLVVFVAVVNPARPRERSLMRLVVAIATVAVLAGASGPILDFLDVSRQSFRLAAGIVMIVGGILTLVDPGGRWRTDGTAPSPELLVAAVSFGADEGSVTTIGAAAVALLALAAIPGKWPGNPSIARLLGGVLVVEAVGLAVSGVLDL